jgi:hypothetical protein
VKVAILALEEVYYYPDRSYNLLSKILIKVDFPAPLEPKIATLESISRPN